MGRIRQVREADGSLSPYRERKVADSINQALAESGSEDRALADELAGVVSLFLERAHPEDSAPPGVIEIQDTVETVLRETGHDAAARRFRKIRTRREELRAQVSVRSTPLRGSSAIARPGERFSAVETSSWSRSRLVRSLAEHSELPGPVAEEVAFAVERKVFALELKSVSAELVRHLVACELFERGLEASDGAGERIPISVRALTEQTIFAPEVGPRTPAEAIAASVLEHYALTEIHGAEVAAAHAEGALHVHGLDRPLAVERLEAPWSLLVRPGRSGDRALLDLRRVLDALRPCVAGAIELPDAVAALLAAGSDSPQAIDDLVDAAAGADAYGRPAGPAIQLAVPLDRTPERLVRALADRVLAREPGSWRIRLVLPDDPAACAQPVLDAAFDLLRATPFAALDLPGPAADDDAAPGLRLALARVTLNLPLLLLNAAGEGLKEGLAGLERGSRLALRAFQERSWAHRRGPPFGIQAIVAALGGPGKVVVPASGQEADVEVWGLGHAVEILAARGLVARSGAPEAAARILGRVLYDLGEDHEGMRFLPRIGGCTARAVRGRMLAACEENARRFGAADVLAELSNERAREGLLPVAIPLSDRRNRALLTAGILERVGFGLGLSEACFPDGLSAATLAGLRAHGRLRTLVLAPPGAGVPFEVQEELFGPGA